uniref:DUF4283 domain-containing protein n=1 Tax=Brassica oleracea var. oleracea TaxID=109376 RepID=A0A0D3A8Q9_BRAOL
MPAQWEMQDKITANDLGNGKFLLNFATEEDLLSVLRQGPFQYIFCMFVLVRWEPVVHDDYPWIIPFWVEITGIPLHLWTIKNLRNIGNRLGLVDTSELEAGRMLIDVDTRKPVTFIRKIASPEGDEVSIQIHYEKLFKHCKTCGMVTHELAYCPTKEPTLRSQGERPGVFARVQLSIAVASRQPLLQHEKPHDGYENHGHERNSRRSRSPPRERRYDGGFMNDARVLIVVMMSTKKGFRGNMVVLTGRCTRPPHGRALVMHLMRRRNNSHGGLRIARGHARLLMCKALLLMLIDQRQVILEDHLLTSQLA